MTNIIRHVWCPSFHFLWIFPTKYSQPKKSVRPLFMEFYINWPKNHRHFCLQILSILLIFCLFQKFLKHQDHQKDLHSDGAYFCIFSKHCANFCINDYFVTHTFIIHNWPISMKCSNYVDILDIQVKTIFSYFSFRFKFRTEFYCNIFNWIESKRNELLCIYAI